MPKLPLKGVRVLDLTIWWAGPLGTMFLADLGAEVIKLEAIQHLDAYRGTFVSDKFSDKLYETSPNFNSANRNKMSLTLDLNSPKGIDLIRRLVKVSDVMFSNYSPRVLENFGLGYEALKQVNPAIIMVTITGFGNSGPWKEYSSFAATSEAMSGAAEITGYPGGPPILPGAIIADPISGVYAALGTIAALRQRQRTGKGQYVDLSLVETTTTMIGDVLMDYSMNKRVPRRRGNRHPRYAPHDVYRCKGPDEWVAIAVRSDDDWQRLCKAMGRPEMATDERFATMMQRRNNQDAAKPEIEGWTSRRDKMEATEALQAAGVPAGAVLSAKDLLADSHLNERGYFQSVDRAEVGKHLYPSIPVRFGRKPLPIRRPAPLLGEHNEHVLGRLLGLSKDEIGALEREQVIGKEPANPPLPR